MQSTTCGRTRPPLVESSKNGDRHGEIIRGVAPEQALVERMDRTLDRIDRHLDRGSELFESHREVVKQHTEQFELTKEVMGELLQRTGENHRQVLKRLDDIGVHMRQQTLDLKRVLDRLD
jgi:hypothetical protein